MIYVLPTVQATASAGFPVIKIQFYNIQSARLFPKHSRFSNMVTGCLIRERKYYGEIARSLDTENAVLPI